MTWGVVPAAGSGTRLQPLAFSKELLPVGSRLEGTIERPRAVGEYVVDRMIRSGASKICFVISPCKSDILQYFGGEIGPASISYVVQPRPGGLCDAIFRAAPLIQASETVVIGLPDTIWFPEDALCALPDDQLSFLLFPVERPQFFDAVITDERDYITEIQVKSRVATSNWIWGAIKITGAGFHELHALWRTREHRDDYLGTLINAYIAKGGRARGIRAGRAYVDVGTLHGYREAIRLLGARASPESKFRGSAELPTSP